MTIKKIQIFLYTVFAFISMQPFFVWKKDWVFAIVGALFILTCFLTRPYTTFSKKIYLFAFFVVAFYGYLMIPFREFDYFGLKHILFMSILVLGVFWLGDEVKKIWGNLRAIFAVIVVLSLASTLLFYLEAPFPSYELKQDFRLKSTDVYTVYYGMIYLNTQVYELGGMNIIRNIGWFGEPGHFGIYLCILLATEEQPFRGRVNKTIMIGVLSTFSAAAYLILFLIFFIKANKSKFLFKVYFLMPFLLLLVYYTNVSLILTWILSKFQGGEAVLEGRAEIDTSVLYHNVVDVLFGRGNGVLEHYGMFSSDLRAFSVKYGLISILLLLLAILPVAWQLIKSSQLKNLGVFLLIVMAVAIHRSWMIDTFYLWFFMLVVLLKSFPIKINKEVASASST